MPGEGSVSASPYDARTLANFVLDIADSRKLTITQLTLLKLLYFAQGWYLAQQNKPLLLQEFEAWKYGPVLKVLRDEFAKYGSGPITGRATILDIFKGERYVAEPRLQSTDATFVQRIFESYHVYDAWQLSTFTHEPNSPWDQIWNSSKPFARMALRITNDEIRSHFLHLPQRFPSS